MGAEFDRLTASVALLGDKVTAVEAFIANLPTPAATPEQLSAFADAVDSANARLEAAVTV